MAAALEPLDLVDIAVLLNYERATTDEHFRDTKVREIAFPGEELRSIRYNPKALPKGWSNNERTWIVLDEVKTQEERQLPANLTGHGFPSPPLSNQQLETVFHRIRAYDACGRVIVLLETFFQLFPYDTALRIRHAPNSKQPGISYITSTMNRSVVQDQLLKPKFSTVLATSPYGKIKYTGTEPEMTHWYMTFKAADSKTFDSVLDMHLCNSGKLDVDLARRVRCSSSSTRGLSMTSGS